MSKAWEKEKAYCQKRAGELAAEMEEAINAEDTARFYRAFETAQRYMRRKELTSWQLRLLARVTRR